MSLEGQMNVYECLDERKPLFVPGQFVFHSGDLADWKIECDHLTDTDLTTLAKVAAGYLPSFSKVQGVPTGGIRFARALEEHVSDEGALLIVDDVLTTGASMEEARDGRNDVIGLVIFSRGELPWWVDAIFQLGLG